MAEIIKITKEHIEVPSNQNSIRIAHRPDFTYFIKDGEIPNAHITVTEELYEMRIVRVADRKKDDKIYFVKVEDNEIFNELMMIGNDDLNHMTWKSLRQGEKDGIEDERKRIAKLSWHRRLLKKF